jgi:hypothetical protein
LDRASNLSWGILAKASLVGAKMVKGPGWDRASLRPTAAAWDNRTENLMRREKKELEKMKDKNSKRRLFHMSLLSNDILCFLSKLVFIFTPCNTGIIFPLAF